LAQRKDGGEQQPDAADEQEGWTCQAGTRWPQTSVKPDREGDGEKATCASWHVWAVRSKTGVRFRSGRLRTPAGPAGIRHCGGRRTGELVSVETAQGPDPDERALRAPLGFGTADRGAARPGPGPVHR